MGNNQGKFDIKFNIEQIASIIDGKVNGDKNFIINLESIADVMVKAYKNNKKLLLCGNGGSAPCHRQELIFIKSLWTEAGDARIYCSVS